MSSRALILAIALIAFIALGMIQFALLYSNSSTVSDAPLAPTSGATRVVAPATPETPTPPLFDPERIYTYYDPALESLTVFGVFSVPTPCHSLRVTSAVTRGVPDRVSINLVSSSTAAACAQVVTPQPFTEVIPAVSSVVLLQLSHNGVSLDIAPPIELRSQERFTAMRAAHQAYGESL